MHLALIGLSHHQAPIDVREKLSCPANILPSALSALVAASVIREAVILSTCNRMELYVVLEEEGRDRGLQSVAAHIAAFHGVERRLFEPFLYRKHDQEAVAHLFRVSSGLDSLVLGEAQILGQVRHALRIALQHKTAGGTLEKLFTQALATGKRVQSETGLGKGGFSIGHAAVDLAARIFDDVSRARVLILGAGKMSELTARHLVRQGVNFVVVANRTYERAVAMAERLGGRAIQFEEAFRTELAQSDIVIASTASPHPILCRENLAQALRRRRGKPLFLIDIAVPRDIDPDVNDLNNVFLYNIDDLQNYLADYAQARAAEAGRAENLVAEETARFMAWYRGREAAPVITAFRSHLDGIRNQYLEIFSSRLAHLSERDRRTIESMVGAMMDQVAREPILRLKRATGADNTENAAEASYDLLAATTEIFGLHDSISNRSVSNRALPDSESLVDIASEQVSGGDASIETMETAPNLSLLTPQHVEGRS